MMASTQRHRDAKVVERRAAMVRAIRARMKNYTPEEDSFFDSKTGVVFSPGEIADVLEADTVECPRDLLKECRNQVASEIDDIGGCDHQVNICCCDLYRLLDWIDRTLKEGNKP